ncbi:MAG: hypothetical protein A3D31_02205 [Candidatus Fluviicola riflensis]|nr:MAG: hypothetical protein CHH17_12835 [Candidatus Fluviicola riflensis]OGS78808.1 MAG: hypothetical protein A3D31_02205 [Candidatus Fluviicola riflensis]OGS85830.1 MAG: hypothetical protein A3E30_09690 [Fluviicola sp. RIFCSPHIGHO2_12_FULL_43_24]OGS86239.1 MAG: hypothetical protein A2724_01660 [Fluviicola sp. RIFCSPHIGHO2_01_FULL_43_53]
MNFISRISSYFYPVTVEKRTGAYLPVLEINLRKGKYLLDGEKVNYSFGSLHTLFRHAFAEHTIDLRSTGNVLILGFGAGSVAQILQNELNLNCKITGVDVDPVVLELGKRYFDTDNYQNTRLICDDAFHFVAEDTEMYDLIVIDLFIERRVPKTFLNTRFMELVKQRLNPGGSIFFNRINDNPFQLEETNELFTAMNLVLEGETVIFNNQQNGINNSILVYHSPAALTESETVHSNELEYAD